MNSNELYNQVAHTQQLYDAVKSNKFDEVHNVFNKGIVLDLSSHDKNELKKICIENIGDKQQRLPRSANMSNFALVAGASFAALNIWFQHLIYDAKTTDIADEGKLILGVVNNLNVAVGLNLFYEGLTNYFGKQPYKDAVAIKQLLIDNKIIDELPIDNGSEEV